MTFDLDAAQKRVMDRYSAKIEADAEKSKYIYDQSNKLRTKINSFWGTRAGPGNNGPSYDILDYGMKLKYKGKNAEIRINQDNTYDFLQGDDLVYGASAREGRVNISENELCEYIVEFIFPPK